MSRRVSADSSRGWTPRLSAAGSSEEMSRRLLSLVYRNEFRYEPGKFPSSDVGHGPRMFRSQHPVDSQVFSFLHCNQQVTRTA